MTQLLLGTGIDRIAGGEVTLPQERYGLVTAAHARSSDGRSSRQILHERLNIRCLFSPEHGLEGVAGAGDKVSSDIDQMTGLPVHSLYQHFGSGDLIPEAVLSGLDALIYDLPDVGVRFYTYISTCLQIIDAAAKHQKKLYILDRPNPLGGDVIEGVTLEERDFSFVGAFTLPIRYGLTVGELAGLYVKERQLDVDLEIITCKGWQRNQCLPETNAIFTIPSPNIPNWQATALYPGTCLIEGTNLSEGRGTTRPFTWFGAPWIDQEELAAALNKLDHPGLAIRPQGFIPASSKNKDQHCKGVAIELVDYSQVRIVRFMVEAIATIKELYPEDFRFIQAFGSKVSFIERLMGKRFVEEGWPVRDFKQLEDESIADFKDRVKSILLYS